MQRTKGIRGQAARAIAWTAVLTVASGCSTFNRDWKRALQNPPPADSIAGAWDGSWESEVNGHKDRLRCLITPASEGRLRARFRAHYVHVLRFGYTVELEARPGGDNTEFEGTANLGWWAGGVYQYEGRATPTNFFSTYSSKRDHGTFEMRRPN